MFNYTSDDGHELFRNSMVEESRISIMYNLKATLFLI
jgi:hypothetical protein